MDSKIKILLIKNHMKKLFSIRNILAYIAIITLIFSSCKNDETIDPTFVMTNDNVSFVFPDTTVQIRGDVMTLQKVKSASSTVMPEYYQYGFFVDSVSGPLSSSLILPLIRLTTEGYRTGEFVFDNSTTKFIPGDYQVFMGTLTPEGKVYFRNNPINVKLEPGFSTSTLLKLTTLNYPVGESVSVEGSFSLNAYYMTGKTITVTTSSSDFPISATSGTNFSSATSITVEPTIDLNYKKIYVRMKPGLNLGDSLTGRITVESTGKTSILLDLKGKVLPINIATTSTNITNLDYNAGAGPSVDKTFTVSGDLTNNLIVTPPANFEIAKETSGVVGAYTSNPITLTKISGGLVLSTILHVRLKKNLTQGSYSDIISLTSTGATSVDVAVKGTVY